MAKQRKSKKQSNKQSRKRRPVRKSNMRGDKSFTGKRVVSVRFPASPLDASLADVTMTVVGRSYLHQGSGQKISTQIQTTGMSVQFFVNPAMFMNDCPYASVTEADSVNPLISTIQSNYQESRITRLRISAKNAGPSTISGTWALGFWPFRTDTSMSSMTRTYTMAGLRNAPYYVEALATKPLSINYVSRISDTHAYCYGTHFKTIGVVGLMFSEVHRAGKPSYSSQDFDPLITTEATVMLTTRNVRPTDRFPNQVLSPDLPGVVDYNHGAGSWYALSNTQLTVEHSPGKDPTYTGTPWNDPGPLSLDGMAID